MTDGRLRVGYDVTSLTMQRSGIGRYALELLCALVRAEPENEYRLLSHRALRADAAAAIASAGLHRLRGPGFPSRIAWMQGILPVALAAADLDVCHFTNYHAPILARGPFVATFHDMSLILSPREHPRLRVATMRPLLRAVARRAAAIITPTEGARMDALRVLEIPPERVHVVPEAPAATFRRVTDVAALDAVRARYRLEPGFLLALGTIEPRKNLSRLVDAYLALRRDGFAEPLVLCGALGWGYSALLDRLRAPELEGAVRILGYVPDADLAPLLTLAGAFAYPSLYEGFGLPIVEAMACGTPTVTSDRGAMAEVAGKGALLVDPEDTAALANALGCALGDVPTRRRLAVAGPQRAADFTWEGAAHRTAHIYQLAAGSPS